MMKRLFVVSAVIGTAVLGSASQVGATPGIGGCGAMYMTLSVPEALDVIDWRPYTEAEMLEIATLVDEFVDANGDDVVCVKQYAANPGQDNKWGFPDYVITKLSDNKSQGR